MIKPVIQWTPKAVQKNPSKNEWAGVFRTHVQAGTPGAVNHQGQIGSSDKTYNYWGLDVTQVSGKIRWVDKAMPNYTGAETKIIIYIEGNAALHKVEIPYDAGNLHNVMNIICGVGGKLPDWHVNLSYWVRPKKDAKGGIVFNDKGTAKLLKTFQILDVEPQFSFDAWKEFSEKHALEWTQKKRADGKMEWVTDAALKYWDSRLVGVQRFLLGTPECLPFTYGSLIASPHENPSGGGNLTEQEIEQAKAIYERRKADFRFPHSREVVDADSIVGVAADPGYRQEAAEVAQTSTHIPDTYFDAAPAMVGGFPTDAPPEGQGENDDLPF